MLGRQNTHCVVVGTLLPSRQLAILAAVLLCFELTVPNCAIAQPAKAKNSLQVAQDLHRKRYREFSNEIKKLADDCDEKGLNDEANEVRSRDFEADFQSFHVNKLPTEVQSDVSVNANGVEQRIWQKRLRYLETEYAKDLYIQSRAALRHKLTTHAYNLIREAALHDPDNEQVRKILGFVRRKNEWVTPFAAKQMNEGKIWHDKFGWLLKTHVDRYEDGERLFRTQWISAEKEKLRRTDFGSAWEVRTDHYLIKTNVSLEKGVEMGKALEDFYGVFTETFAAFFNTPEQLQKLFDTPVNNIRADRWYTVHFYRSREEYIERMRKFFPAIEQTNGVYLTSDRIAHFYFDPNRDHEGTLFHEATHQLFYESEKTTRTICDNHHFWIIEGIACYMESFQRNEDGTFSLGDLSHIRFFGARNNLLRKNYYVPLREFSGFGMQEFQLQPEPTLAKNYTQAAGLARFFMHYDNGRYREALVKHLTQLYSASSRVREDAESLDELTGIEFTELDRQYAEDAAEVDTRFTRK